jgi:hypothetical protein
MKLVEINWQPTDLQLLQFGLVCFVALPAIAWLWGASLSVIAILATIGLAISLVGMIAPPALKYLFLALSLVTTPIGVVVGELAMLVIYFGCFLPIGIVFRVFRRDALTLKLDRNATSYWESKKQPTSLASYYRQS